jgi:hypothetical protein
MLDTDNIYKVRESLELLARGIATAGTLSALALQVQLDVPAATPSFTRNHPNARDQILALSLPSEE